MRRKSSKLQAKKYTGPKLIFSGQNTEIWPVQPVQLGTPRSINKYVSVVFLVPGE